VADTAIKSLDETLNEIMIDRGMIRKIKALYTEHFISNKNRDWQILLKSVYKIPGIGPAKPGWIKNS